MSQTSYFSSISPDLLAMIFSSLPVYKIFDICQEHELKICDSRTFWNSLYYQMIGKPLPSGRAKDWYKLAHRMYWKYAEGGDYVKGAAEMAKLGLLQEVKEFTSHSKPDWPELFEALLNAAKFGHPKIVQFLIDTHQFRPIVKEEALGLTKYDEIIDILLPLAEDKNQVLKVAAKAGNSKIFFRMIKQKETHEGDAIDPRTISYALMGGSPDIIKYLFSLGLVPYIGDFEHVIGSNSPEAVKLFIEHGFTNLDTAFELAIHMNISMAEYLAKYMTDMNKVLEGGIRLKNLNLVQYAIQNGVVVTPELLNQAIGLGNLEIFKLLIDYEPTLDLADAHRYAEMIRKTDVAKYIVSLI